MTNMTGSKLSICSHPGKITGYWITTRSFPYRGPYQPGLDFVSGQYGCLFSRCWKYVINSLIHGHFHIGLFIIPRPILALDSFSGQFRGLGMITRSIWKWPCINLYLLIFTMQEKILIMFMNIYNARKYINNVYKQLQCKKFINIFSCIETVNKHFFLHCIY